MKLHHTHVWDVARSVFPVDLKPSYSFISAYDTGVGKCPVHTDRPQCYYTIDVCINQNRPWPIYVNSEDKFLATRLSLGGTYEESMLAEVMSTSKEYILNTGDALCYSGTHHPHWRKPIDLDQYCDLVFFHFVGIDFTGSLEPND
jgi:hypothetical protein